MGRKKCDEVLYIFKDYMGGTWIVETHFDLQMWHIVQLHIVQSHHKL